MTEIEKLIEKWKNRQSCNNQPEQNDISKAKAHIYGICSEELKNVINRFDKKENIKKCAKYETCGSTDMYPCSTCDNYEPEK